MGKSPPPLTPEQLVIANVEMLRQHRRLTHRELGERMASLGFAPWIWERTVRNFLNGERGLKVDELAGLAVALETTIADLLHAFPRHREITVGSLLGVYKTLHHRQISGPIPGRPSIRADWSSPWTAKPPAPPKVLAGLTSTRARVLVAIFQELEWPLPADEDQLSDEDIKTMEERFDVFTEMEWEI